MMTTMMYLIGVGLMTSSNMSDIKRIGDRESVSVLADENDDDEEGQMVSRHIITHLLLPDDRDAPCGDGVIVVVSN